MPDSVVELARVVRTELHHLSTRESAIRLRIRRLHRALQGLQDGVGRSAFDHVCTEVYLLRERLPGRTGEKLGGRSDSRPQFVGGRRSEDASLRLKRACRIALMELEEPASVEEIYSRIARRGSFSFMNPEYAGVAIARALGGMAQQGEVYCLNDGPCWLWKRKYPDFSSVS